MNNDESYKCACGQTADAIELPGHVWLACSHCGDELWKKPEQAETDGGDDE